MRMSTDVRRLLYSIISLLALLVLLYVKMPFADRYENAVKENIHLIEEAALDEDMKFIENISAFTKKVATHHSYNNCIRVITLNCNTALKAGVTMINTIHAMEDVLNTYTEEERAVMTEDEANEILDDITPWHPAMNVDAMHEYMSGFTTQQSTLETLIILFTAIETVAITVGLWVVAEFILMIARTRKQKRLV